MELVMVSYRFAPLLYLDIRNRCLILRHASAQSVHAAIGCEMKMQFFGMSRDLFLSHFTDCRMLIPSTVSFAT
jgi:hypothetical protein